MNPNRKSFQKRLIASVVASSALTGFSGGALAQQGEPLLEEVVVTGIRGSLEQAMDIKRDATGVVDAISAEDIGKFPDTNLAESLQRITGVSIDRRNGEGSSVTIRGFGGDNNMVTLNGRQLPAASTFGGGSGASGTRGGGTRAFDFANLASESVSGLEVYKTGRASIATGGIGGTINIKTARPLDRGTEGSVGFKAVHDTTTLTGDDLTPEVSGIFSWTDDSDTFGVSLAASFQERDSGAAGATSNDWNIGRWGEDELYSFTDDAVIENAPEEGQLYGRPNDVRYSVSDRHRERTNAMLTLQFQPQDNLTLTGDLVYAENYLTEHRGEQTFWYANGNTVDRLVFDDSAVATPAIYSETLANKDNGYEQQWREQRDELTSIGFNAEWQVNDRLSFSFDVHDSTMESLPDGPGNAGSIDVSVANPTQTSQVTDWDRDLPLTQATYENGFSLDDFGSQVARIWYAGQTTDVTQVQLDGAFEFDDGRFDFGVESRTVEMEQQNSDRYMALGDWGVANPGEIPDGLLQEFSLLGQFDDYPTSGGFQGGARGNPVALAEWAVSEYGTAENGYAVAYNPNFSNNNLIEEDINALFAQVTIQGELGGMETNLVTGFRYETTDVTSTSFTQIPAYRVWQDNNDFQTVYSDTTEAFTVKSDYDNLLPSLDFDILLAEDVKARFSYSKTIARAGYGQLAASVGGFGNVGSTYLGSTPTANATNPALKPLESDNLDLSVEWYYDDSSYVSAGFFEKRVSNFIGTDQIPESHFGLRDVTNGPRVEEAAQALSDGGYDINDTSLFVMTAVLDNPDAFPNGAADYTDDADFAVDVATEYDLIPNSEDPLMIFNTATPVNNREAKLYGSELAAQHFFGDTGFGVQANYTIVRGDVAFNDLGDPSEAQFALLGLSDTANLVGIYENYGFTVRLAYNWRDKFLNETNRGNSRNPVYVEEYSQLDLNVAYNVTDDLSVFFEGINLTEENIRQHGRSENQLWDLQDQGARYQIGARYAF